jgi:hypothetical protein
MITEKNKLFIVTRDHQIKKLIGFILENNSESQQLEVVFDPILNSLFGNSKTKELLLIDVNELLENEDWINVLMKRRNLRVIIQFTEMKTTLVKEVKEYLDKNAIANSIEFIILGNYSSELKILILKEQFTYLFQPN